MSRRLPGGDDDRANQIEPVPQAIASRIAGFFRQALKYWRSDAWVMAWLLSAGLLGTILAGLGAAYAMNVWNRSIFDSLQQKDAANVAWLSMLYFALLAVSLGFSVMQVFVRMTLQRRWRIWVSNALVDRWIVGGRYYQLNLVPGDHANPEARIVDDIRQATESPVDFVSGILQAVLSAAMFIFVLWSIGGALAVPLGGHTYQIPGFLVIAAVLYACVASGAMLLIGNRFVKASEDKNHAEAEFRYVLTRLRENGESIALIRGEEEERAGVALTLGAVDRAWTDITWQTLKTTMVSQTSSYIAPVLPIILCAPKLVAGEMSLGEVMQAASAFTIVQGAFNWLVDNYPKMADWRASANRVGSLVTAIEALELAEKEEAGRIEVRVEPAEAALRLVDVSVRLNDGTAVVGDTDVAIAPGERVLIAGESGSGKSTLVRAIAGLWPWGAGTVTIKQGSRMFLLPQRPYIPIGTLRRAAAYPEAPDAFSRDIVAAAFEKVGLARHVERLDEEAPWDQTLSGGEKQRLAFARIFIHKPDIVVLDEATAALDTKSQLALMALLVAEPGLTVLSVGHREELEQFHTRKIELEKRPGGARLIRDHALGDHQAHPPWFQLSELINRLRGKAAA